MADFIIVGAGSAGCVLANRLSADPGANVVLLEAGGGNGNLLYRMPAGFFPLMKAGKGNWNFETVPQPSLNGRTMYFPRGKVLGGSSSINGLVVSRGNPGDYDHWAQLGNQGWSWDDCLPCRTVRTRGTSFMLLIGSQEDGSNDQARPRYSAQAQGAAPR